MKEIKEQMDAKQQKSGHVEPEASRRANRKQKAPSIQVVWRGDAGAGLFTRWAGSRLPGMILGGWRPQGSLPPRFVSVRKEWFLDPEGESQP